MYPSELDHLNDHLYDDKEMLNLKMADRGFNRIYRNAVRESDGKITKRKIDLYTTGGTGSNIRDAETGMFYVELVGSKYEDLYFKVALATGECKSLNGSNTLFYFSPGNYERHLNVNLSDDVIHNWVGKKNMLLAEMNKTVNKKETINVH